MFYHWLYLSNFSLCPALNVIYLSVYLCVLIMFSIFIVVEKEFFCEHNEFPMLSRSHFLTARVLSRVRRKKRKKNWLLFQLISFMLIPFSSCCCFIFHSLSSRYMRVNMNIHIKFSNYFITIVIITHR